MSVNKDLPHVLVLPEDGANRQIANGFLLDQSLMTRQIRVLAEAGGWTKVLEQFESVHVRKMDVYPDRFMVLLVDFDGQENRLDHVKAAIPGHLKHRVFVLG